MQIGLSLGLCAGPGAGRPFNVPQLPLFSDAFRSYQAGGPPLLIGVAPSDSIGAGTTAPTSLKQNGYFRWLADIIAARYPTLKTRHDSFYGLSTAGMASFLAANPEVTASTDWTSGAGTSLGGNVLINSVSGSVNPFTYNPGTVWDQVEIAYICRTAGDVVNVSIGGATIDSFDTVGADLYLRKVVTVPRGANALTLKKAGGASKTAEITHLRFIDTQNPAIDVISMGGSGWRSSEWVTTTRAYSTLNALDDETGVKLWLNQIQTNDAEQTTATPAATFKANQQLIINRQRTTGADIVLIVPPPSDSIYAARHADFQGYTYELAATNGLPVVDILARWVDMPTAISRGFMATGNLHPKIAGHQDMALAVSEVILPA